MSFFTDKWIVGEMKSNELVLLRKSKGNIFLERLSQNKKGNKEHLTAEVLEEYDAAILSDKIYVLYQNVEGHLILIVVNGNKKEEIQLTHTGLSEVFNLCLEIKDKFIHILYAIRGEGNKYYIKHHFYDGSKWEEFLVDEISVKKVINQMKAILMKDRLHLIYYNDDYNISIKSFNLDNLTWSNSFNLISNSNEKLFLDGIVVNNNLHLAFCEYVDENLVVKYLRYECQDENYIKTAEEFISNEGSPSHPTVIYYKNDLWITWLELDKVFSRLSKDMGNSWTQIYMWNETKKIDFIRYKYLAVEKDENVCLNYSFGSIYPEIRFLGFGSTRSAVEIPVKKKTTMRFRL